MKNESSTLIKYSQIFNKQRKSLPLEIKIAFRQARELYIEYPDHPSLRDHSFRNEFSGYRSIDVTGNYRAIYRKRIEGEREIITFHMIGTHSELYGR